MLSDVAVMEGSERTQEELQRLRQLTLVVYILYAVSWFFVVPAIVAIVTNHVKRGDTRGTLYESHFSWQIRTFWWSLGWGVLGLITLIILIGYVILFVSAIWNIYRIVRGFLNWSDRKPMPA